MIKKRNNELWQILYPSLRIERYIFNLLSNRIILNGYVTPRKNKLTGIISMLIKSRRRYNSLAMSLCSDNLCQIWVLTSWICDILCVSYVCIVLIHIASCNSRLSKNHGIKRSFSDCSLLLINKNYTTPYFLFFYI